MLLFQQVDKLGGFSFLYIFQTMSR